MRAVRWAGIAAVAAFLVLVARYWHPVYGFTEFIQLDASNDDLKIAAFRRYPVYVYRDTGGYDGIAYAQIACHPSLRAPELSRAVDSLSYRARRILPSVLAWLLAGGQEAWIAQAYAIVNVLAWLALAAFLWRVLPVSDWKSWTAWLGALFSAGALVCVRLALTDLIAAGLIAAAVRSVEQRREDGDKTVSPRAPALWMALAALSRETSLLAIPALWERPWLRLRNVLIAAGAVIPLALWMTYIRHVVGRGDAGWTNFTWPGAGLAEKVGDTWHAFHTQSDFVMVATTLLAVVALIVQAAWLLAQADGRNGWWRLGVIFIGEMLLLGPRVWEGFPGAAFRVLLPLTIATNVLAARRRASWAVLVAANLTVFAGLMAFRDVPFDNHEVAATRSGSRACEVTEGAGWYGAEHTSRHRWAWAQGEAPGAVAALDFQTWPPEAVVLRCRAQLRSLAAQQVTLTQGRRTLWSGAVGPGSAGKTAVEFSVDVRGGRAQVLFRSARAGTREAPDAGARALAFALYDLKVSFTDAGSDPH